MKKNSKESLALVLSPVCEKGLTRCWGVESRHQNRGLDNPKRRKKMKKSLLIALLCVLMAFMAVSCDNEPAAKPEPEDKVLVDISKFTDDNYGVFTDGYYRSGEKDERTVVDGYGS